MIIIILLKSFISLDELVYYLRILMAFLYRNGFQIVHNHNKQYEMCQKLTSTNSLQVTHIEFDSMLKKELSNVH